MALNKKKLFANETLSSRLSKKVKYLKTPQNIASICVYNTAEKTEDSPLQFRNVDLSKTKLDFSFFNCPCITLANKLLGKTLVRKLESGDILRGRIVETECYLGVEDKASHSYQGKKTERNQAMFMPSGTAYVYSIYGKYYCFNISSFEDGSAVLIRALEPLEGTPFMQQFRSLNRKSLSPFKNKQLCDGPSKLCQAFSITKWLHNMKDLTICEDLWLEDGEDIEKDFIISCKRIGIDSAGEEWANKPLRFYVKDCIFVSVHNRVAENSANTR